MQENHNAVIDEALIEGVTEIANREVVVKETEANICFHKPIEHWMTKRILIAEMQYKRRKKGEDK